MDYLKSLLELIQKAFVWWVIIVPWERGIRVRGGKKVKLLPNGLHFRIPFFDQVYTQTVRLRVLQVPPQTVSTTDGKTLTIVSAVGYTIEDIFKVFQSLHSPETTLCNIVMGEIAEFVSTHSFEECHPSKIEEKAAEKLRMSNYGLNFEYLKITGYAVVRTYRIIQDGHWLPNELSTSVAK